MSPAEKEQLEKEAATYIVWQMIDYGDLNEMAEDQIKEAYISGYMAAMRKMNDNNQNSVKMP